MPCSKRRRGGQPGNQNAVKHGRCRRIPGRQPGSPKAAVHVRSALIPASPASPWARSKWEPQGKWPAPHIRTAPVGPARPPGWLAGWLACLEAEAAASLDDPYCDRLDLTHYLRRLNRALDRLLRDLSPIPPADPKTQPKGTPQ